MSWQLRLTSQDPPSKRIDAYAGSLTYGGGSLNGRKFLNYFCARRQQIKILRSRDRASGIVLASMFPYACLVRMGQRGTQPLACSSDCQHRDRSRLAQDLFPKTPMSAHRTRRSTSMLSLDLPLLEVPTEAAARNPNVEPPIPLLSSSSPAPFVAVLL